MAGTSEEVMVGCAKLKFYIRRLNMSALVPHIQLRKKIPLNLIIQLLKTICRIN